MIVMLISWTNDSMNVCFTIVGSEIICSTRTQFGRCACSVCGPLYMEPELPVKLMSLYGTHLQKSVSLILTLPSDGMHRRHFNTTLYLLDSLTDNAESCFTHASVCLSVTRLAWLVFVKNDYFSKYDNVLCDKLLQHIYKFDLSLPACC